MEHIKSSELFKKSIDIFPGGVNSPVRAYQSVGLLPPFIAHAKGSQITDVDGNTYIDYVGSWGPMILGHAHEAVVKAICEAAELGTSYGAPTEKEWQLGSLIQSALPSMEMMRLVSSGTEAAMSALRVARGYTGRDKILKFEGCYHGHSDGLLVKAGSGALTMGAPDSLGVPKDFAKHTLVATYNHSEAVEEIFNAMGNEIAAVIVEPIAANMGVVLPNLEFLQTLRRLTEHYGAVLIFDEVITGFRASFGGAQGYYGITPDLTVLGKIIGGGMPVGAYGGRREIMNTVSPLGAVYQAGTLSGNPIAMAAGIKTLELLRDTPHVYETLEQKGKELESAFSDASRKHGIDLAINRVGSLLGIFFNDQAVEDYGTAIKSNGDRFKTYFKNMLEMGIYTAPSQFEGLFVSLAHSQEDLAKTRHAIDNAFRVL